MHALNRQIILLSITLTSVFTLPGFAAEPRKTTVDSGAPQSSVSMAQSNAEEAIRLQRETTLKEPSNWQAHSALSTLLWRQGNIFPAIAEAETAAKLNPTNPVALTNLALMKQNSNSYGEAISLYRRVMDVDPNGWVAPLGICRCYILEDDPVKGLKGLNLMATQTTRNFDWYYMTARTCFEIDETGLAEQTTSKAVSVATTQKERAAAQNLLLLERLRANKLAAAKSLQEQVFQNNSPKEAELYVRTAAMLIPPSDPTAGRRLLNRAIENITAPQASDVFVRLGRVFEDKSEDKTCDVPSRMSWLASSRAAFERAIALSPQSPGYHLALAGVLSSEGKLADAAEEMRKNMSLDRNDVLSKYLIAETTGTGTPLQDKPKAVNLSLVRFTIDGLNCACHLSKIYNELNGFSNVVFISTPPQKPYTGEILVDQSKTSAKDILTKISQNPLPAAAGATGPLEKVKLEIISESPIQTVDAALKVAQEVRFGSVLTFPKTFSECFNRFKEIAPIMPPSTPNTPAVQTASAWSAPL